MSGFSDEVHYFGDEFNYGHLFFCDKQLLKTSPTGAFVILSKRIVSTLGWSYCS